MSKTVKILLVEDDGDDVDLLQEALTDNNVSFTMDVIRDGGLVSDYCEKCTSYPDVIILDLNLPRVPGGELLKYFKQSPDFKQIPVVILTTSNAPNDIEFAYREGAEKFLIKPTTVQGINVIVATIMEVV